MTDSGLDAGATGPPRVGPYELLEPIGRGATGTVYLARAEGAEEVVALKMLHGGASDEAVDRFTREVTIARGLVHRHVVRVLDSGSDDGVAYLVMERLQGQSLRDIIREHPDGLDRDTAVDLVAQLCLGLHHAHEQGLVHRDVKPANAFVTGESVVKILDFGVAKLSDTTVTDDGALVGTLAYMAPEQLSGRGEIDGRADVFSAGVMLFELLTGRRPFDAESSAAMLARILNDQPTALPSGLTDAPALQALIGRALEKDPERRYGSAQEFAYALWTLQHGWRGHAVKTDLPLSDAGDPPSADVDAPVATPGADNIASNAAAPAWRALPPAALWLAAALIVALIGLGGTMAWNRGGDNASGGPVAAGPRAAGPTNRTGAPVAATAGDVRVETVPPGATISVDGTPRGETPASLRLEKDQSLELAAGGYEPATVVVDASTLQAGRVVVNLSPLARARLRANGPYPFEIVSEGTTISAMSQKHEISVSVGQVVSLRSREFLLDQTVKIVAEAGGTQVAQVPALGRLSVRTRPGADEQCRVLIDRRDFSNPPLSNLRVAAGLHQLQLRCPDGSTRQDRVRVPAGEPVVHTMK